MIADTPGQRSSVSAAPTMHPLNTWREGSRNRTGVAILVIDHLDTDIGRHQEALRRNLATRKQAIGFTSLQNLITHREYLVYNAQREPDA